MWQKCPVCNGTGKSADFVTTSSTIPVCDVCNGKKIISQVNGLPPASGIDPTSTDFRDGNMETQQEYYGH